MANRQPLKSSWKALPARFFYVTKKNARTMTEKMVVRKYDPVARKHVNPRKTKSNKSADLLSESVLSGAFFIAELANSLIIASCTKKKEILALKALSSGRT